MASRKTLLAAAAMALVVVTAALLPAATTANKTFTVGDDKGWDVGVDYVAWAHGKKFRVGDKLVFRPIKAGQFVVVVDKSSFDACVTPGNAQVLSTGDPYTGTLVASGPYFFICSAPGACESGMKLTINVVD